MVKGEGEGRRKGEGGWYLLTPHGILNVCCINRYRTGIATGKKLMRYIKVQLDYSKLCYRSH